MTGDGSDEMMMKTATGGIAMQATRTGHSGGPEESTARKSALRRGFSLALFGAVAVLLAIACSGPANADDLDRLYLTGVIKNVNPVTGLVYVDVRSESCHGMRIFKADDLEGLIGYIGMTVSFFIDSNTCDDTSIHTIRVSRGFRQ